MIFHRALGASLLILLGACSSKGGTNADNPGGGGDDGGTTGDDGGTTDGSAPPCTGTPADCAKQWEQAASDRFDAVLGNPTDLAAFLKGVPKGGDLHNHLTGAVYGETYLAWALADGDCINTTSFTAVYSSSCSASTQTVPTSGTFFDSILAAWSMKGFVPGGAENGHDHFFATFAKYGAIAGGHRYDDIADVAKRAADENEVYVETMFNLGTNVGALAATDISGTVTADTLSDNYAALMADTNFATKLAADVKSVTDSDMGWKTALGCSGATPPSACNVRMRFVAQISRTGALDTLFGQLVSAYEMAEKTPLLVALDLSSPEDDVTSLKNYAVHMAMLDFLNGKYTATNASPLHVTLHAGELAPQFLPAGYETSNTFHVRQAVETAHAERIGHAVDIMSETDAPGLLDEMSAKGVAVEVCLSSNDQILQVSGTNHPLAQFLAHHVPVALATDDQGVSRSSMAGEYLRAATDQKLNYRQLKTIARDSLEHSFLPGASLWTTIADATPTGVCASTATMGVGDPATGDCQTFLAGSEKATAQWELEHRFRDFESHQ